MALEARDVAPCAVCGHDPAELEHLARREHRYVEWVVLQGEPLVLCDFCTVDFGSYDPTFFGLPRKHPIGYEYMQLVRDIREPAPTKDQFCPSCNHRLTFLRFVARVRERVA